MAALWTRVLGRVSGGSQHYETGIRHFDRGEYEAAIVSFRSALDKPGCGALTERLARFYLSEAHSALAMQRVGQGDQRVCDDETLQNLRSAAELSPNYADLRYHLGRAFISRSEWDDAVEALTEALRINPAYAKATAALGLAKYLSGDREGGLSLCDTALGLDPAFSREAFDEAVQRDGNGETERAAAALRRIDHTATGDDALFHARLGMDLFRRGMFDEAADEYRQALAINPGYADVRHRLGVSLVRLARDAEAVDEFKRALNINPRYIEARLNLGLSCARLGRREEARNAFEAILELDLGNAAALEALASVEESLGPR